MSFPYRRKPQAVLDISRKPGACPGISAMTKASNGIGVNPGGGWWSSGMASRKRLGQLLALLGLALIVMSLFFRYDTCPSYSTNGSGPQPPVPGCAPSYTWSSTGFIVLVTGIGLVAIGGFLALFRPSS